MHRLTSAQSEAEIIAIVRDYVHDWDPGESAALALNHVHTSNQTERFVIATARARLAEIEESRVRTN
jgi:hypothetical protein